MLQNRRSFLKAGGLVAAMGLAGCTGGLLEQGGDSGGSGDGDWKYDPSTLATVGNKFFGDIAFGQIYDNREYLPKTTQENFEMENEEVPIAASDIDMVTGVGGGQISVEGDSGSGFGSAAILGSWEKSAMETAIESEGEATQAGEYEGFSLYENAESTAGSVSENLESQASAVIGIGDDAMLMGVAAAEGASTDVTGEAAVKTMIDASNGDAPLLANNSEYMSQITSSVSANSMLAGGEIDPALIDLAVEDMGSTQQQYVKGLRAGGFGASIEGETTTFSVAILYQTGAMAEETGLAGLAKGLAPTVEEENAALDSLDAKYESNAVVINMTGPTKKIFEEGQETAAGGTQLDIANPAGPTFLP